MISRNLIEESRCLECELPVVFVDIEHAPLRSRVCRGFRFVDRRCNTVNVEDAGKCQAAEPGTDDRDWSIHPDSLLVGGRREICRQAVMERHSM